MDNLFFYSSKILWMLLSPDSLFVLLLTVSLLLLFFNRQKTAVVLLSIVTVCILSLSFFSLGGVMLYPLESRFNHNPELPEQVDGIIMLGGSVIPDVSNEWQQLETNSSHERIRSFIELAHRYPLAILVMTGGNASLDRNKPSEADIMKKYLLKSGIEGKRLVLENRSRNTAENATRTRQIIKPEKNQTWLLITTAFHMPRSVGLFCRQGFKVIPYPVDHQTIAGGLYDINYNLMGHASEFMMATHEWLGLLAYYLSGKIDTLIPGACD